MATFETISHYIREKFCDFLETYNDPTLAATSNAYYLDQIHLMQEEDQTTLYVDFEHLSTFDADLADLIQEHHYRLDPVLKKALQNVVRDVLPEFVQNEENVEKEFWVSFFNMPILEKMRDLKTGHIGKLVAFTGMITRTSEVRPELYLGTFKCLECGTVVRNVEQQFKYTQPLICANATCGNRRNWDLLRDECAFIDWQRVKVQECSDEVPPGSLPRSLEIIMRHDLVESVRAGDRLTIVGNLIVIPDVSALTAPGEKVESSLGQSRGEANAPTDGVSGMKVLGCRELTYRMSFLASSTQSNESSQGLINVRSDDNCSPDELWASMSDSERELIENMKKNPRLYDDLSRSLVPGVFGHDDVKRAILLMLLGGVHKKTREGMALRGDINVAIVGDPSCGKSQILKYVADFIPRAIYTSGKSSSAAGLTATVVKESDSNEFCIEAGALLLADNGVCCIDEFDKMDVKDQVAIHEAMEQQTISIAKAGIQATLNARTSILAAANPMSGRYDKSKPLRYNVALPPAILSRFDLLHIMIDDADPSMDRKVAEHILSVHMSDGSVALNKESDMKKHFIYQRKEIQSYIRFVRSIKPKLTDEARQVMVSGYKQLRAADSVPGSSMSYRITVRQLEALVRLSEALASLSAIRMITLQSFKKHSARDICSPYLQAVRLVKMSILSIESADLELPANDLDSGTDDLAGVSDVIEKFKLAQSDKIDSNDSNSDAKNSDEPNIDEETKKKQCMKVSQKKIDEVKNLLVLRLREIENSGSSHQATIGELDVAAITQHDLLVWYFEYQSTRMQFNSHEDLQNELRLVCKIVQHLIRREAVLIVVEVPTRLEDESDESYNKRLQRDRVLALNPNYTDE